MPVITHRLLVGLAVAGALVAAGCSTTGASPAIQDHAPAAVLPVPPLLSGTRAPDGTVHYRLRAAAGAHDFGTGTAVPSLGFNGSYLGPTLEMRSGDRVAVDVRNGLAEPTTVHWHGMSVPARSDGGPHQVIAPGGRWSPMWTVNQPAATLWYHPHPHGQTAQQVYRGLAGMILIRDAARYPGLPDTYGVDDLPVVVQDKSFAADGTPVVDPVGRSATGFLGDTVVVNGVVGAYRELTTEAVRLRLLNASNARFYRFALSDGRPFAIVGSDGGLLPAPVVAEQVQLSPGERAEIVLRVQPGETVDLVSEPPDLGHGIGTSDRFGGGRFRVLQLRAADRLDPSPPLPDRLTGLPRATAPTGATRRSFGITDHAINGAPMDLSRIDQVVPVKTPEIWTVTNQNPQPHNFHVHDGPFRVLSVDGQPPPPELTGLKDTVYVAPRSSVDLLVTFPHADPRRPYMYHCHLLLHEDVGVMGQFMVVRPGQRPVPPAPVTGAHHGVDPLRR